MRYSQKDLRALQDNLDDLDGLSVDEQITRLSDKHKKSRKGKVSRKLGEIGEGFARNALLELGLRRVEKIETGWRVSFDSRGKPVSASPLEKVSGDFKAVVPGSGRAVHVEVKLREENLRLSHFKKHQIDALDEMNEIGGLALICWAREDGRTAIMKWPVPGLEPRHSITWEHAQNHLVGEIYAGSHSD